MVSIAQTFTNNQTHKTMKHLFIQLESNTAAIERLDVRFEETKTSRFFKTFKTSADLHFELNKIKNIKKRVVNSRHTILENIKIEAVKELQHISTEQRKNNLSNKAA